MTSTPAAQIAHVLELADKATPGDWKRVIGHDCDFVEPVNVLPSPYNVVSRVGEHTFNREQCNDNAAFIASAPLMAQIIREQQEAIKQLVGYIHAEEKGYPEITTRIDMKRAALKLAKPFVEPQSQEK